MGDENLALLNDAVRGLQRQLEVTAQSPSETGAILCQSNPEEFVGVWTSAHTLRQSGWRSPIELFAAGTWAITPLQERLLRSIDVQCRTTWQSLTDADGRSSHPILLALHALAESPFTTTLFLDRGHVALTELSPFVGMLGSAALLILSRDDLAEGSPSIEPCVLVIGRKHIVEPLKAVRAVARQADLGTWSEGRAVAFLVEACRQLRLPIVSIPTASEVAGGAVVTTIERLGTGLAHPIGREGRRADFWSIGPVALPSKVRDAIESLAPLRRVLAGVGPLDAGLLPFVAGRVFEYTRVEHDSRRLELCVDGRIGEGQAAMETEWALYGDAGEVFLEIYGRDGLTARLVPVDLELKLWQGQWVIHECMPVSLVALGPSAG